MLCVGVGEGGGRKGVVECVLYVYMCWCVQCVSGMYMCVVCVFTCIPGFLMFCSSSLCFLVQVVVQHQ